MERGTLNRHLQRLDLPLATAKQETAAALLEPPGLLLRCRLAPLVPRALIQFLLLAISPSSLRPCLAETVNSLLGHGPHWDEGLESCIARENDEEATNRLRKAYAD